MTKSTNIEGGKVTVLGLGSMGSAIAGALVSKGFQVTVWNRNMEKADNLQRRGARPAKDPFSAISASSAVVICVSDYKVTRKILGDISPGIFMGKTLIQLSTGTPKEARDLHAWGQKHGAGVLNGDIMAWPRQIGTPEAYITISGTASVFEQQTQLLNSLAGIIDFAGEEPGASGALFSAMMAFLAGNWIGFCHGALICEKEGLRPDAFGELVANISPVLAEESRHMGEVIQKENFSNPESTIFTTANGLHLLVQQANERGINTELPSFAAGLFQRAVDAGYGGEEHAAIIKVLRETNESAGH
ncbi:NAD(P)-dependent oxidoreductase [Desertivirga brevis]|uniref:NAD(P)-dependent oxidoreductase n=1 Tax=Desertivirga brevis TaxID=2810310 RepID=UPI001A960A59|nr:NAD(P)-dependent oxidoreductase [Pedobacter sp. SYSU D00873]